MKLVWRETGKALIIIFSIILLSSLLINTLYYFNVISTHTIKYFKMIFLVISFLIGGLYMGKHSPNKGYLYGIRLSLFVIIIFILFGILFQNLNSKRILYYLITTICITFGSMIGINKKDN